MNVDNNVAMENTLPRPDIDLKVGGTAKYTTDVFPPKMIYAKYVRFPYGTGKVTSADVEAARKIKGVLHVEVDTAKTAQYPGDRVGKIAAESELAIEDAESALKLKFERDKPRTDARKFTEEPPAPKDSDAQKLKAIFDDPDAKVVESTYITQVQTHSCLEPHCCVIDCREDGAKAWASTQGVMGWEEGLASSSGHAASKVTVVSEFVGGGFGSKFGLGAEGNLALEMSKKFNRPCRVVLDRWEEHLDAGNRPGSIQSFKMAVKKDGTILGGRIHAASIVGFKEGGGGVADAWLQYYNVGHVVRTQSDIALNFALPRAFRAPGYPQAAFAFEGIMDEMAAAAGMDPVEFRIKNDTSERRREQYEYAVELIGWNDRKPDGADTGIVKTGYGVASASWFNTPGKCEADVDIHSDGTVEVRVGVQDIGTGTSAVARDVVADHLGIEGTLVTGKVGVSDYPPGPASGGSFVTRTTAPALKDAAQNALDKLRRAVAQEWGADEASVKYEKGSFTNGTESLPWKGACALINGKISGHGSYNNKFFGEGNSDCVQFAKVEVDTETGNIRVKKIVAVHSIGKPVNRLTAENQVYGGVIQGISYALFEERLLDPHTGGMVNADFIGYKIAGAADIPEIIPVLYVTEGDTGARSMGEPVTVPTSAAIGNAVANAIGVRVYELPMTPDRVLAALARKKGATA